MPEEDENMETSECQNVMTSESEIAINIPDSIKQFLEDDFINVKYNRKVAIISIVNFIDRFHNIFQHHYRLLELPANLT